MLEEMEVVEEVVEEIMDQPIMEEVVDTEVLEQVIKRDNKLAIGIGLAAVAGLGLLGYNKLIKPWMVKRKKGLTPNQDYVIQLTEEVKGKPDVLNTESTDDVIVTVEDSME